MVNDFLYFVETAIQGDFGNPWKDKRFIIMQFTGLKDKNGKEIYEGDIVQCPECGDEYKISKVGFSDGAFCIWGENEKTLQHWMVSQFKLEVIGNIYENLNLLK